MDSTVYLVAPLLGWFSAQGIKFALSLHKNGITVSDAFQSGGMPSSHSAFMMAITTVIGLNVGFLSPLFALALATSMIIMYDARGVRLATGQQADAIKKLAKKNDIKVDIVDARGHIIAEVVAGAVLGILVGLLTDMLV
jgi:uncharacterized protein